MKYTVGIVVLLSVAIIAAYVLLDSSTQPIDATISVSEALGGDTTGYRRAEYPASIRFPEDHGAHPQYRTEWWYYTGNLRSEADRPFGYQFTIFRTALTPDTVATSASAWRSNQLYTAHFAVSDVASDRFLFTERSSRGANGLAGTSVRPFGVWLENWEIRQRGADAMDQDLKAAAGSFSVELRLSPGRGPLLQGSNGFSPKDRDSTNASYYYSYTRLATAGYLTVGTDTFRVEGETWMDHEWSTSALSPSQVGWDWFALRLSDGSDVMYFQVREESEAPPFVEGTVRDSDGRVTRLSYEGVRFEVLDRWESAATGILYPAKWSLEVPDLNMQLTITPLMRDQEMRLSVRYWEGAVAISGSVSGRDVTGEGYVELTGYGDDLSGVVLDG